MRARAQWVFGGDASYPFAAQRLVMVLSGSVNSDSVETSIGSATLSILATGGLTDMNRASQNASISNIFIDGTWGDSSQPNFLTQMGVLALPYGNLAGLDAGDGLLLRFDQPVEQLELPDKEHVDAVFVFNPSNWAQEYSGSWVSDNTLFIVAERWVSRSICALTPPFLPNRPFVRVFVCSVDNAMSSAFQQRVSALSSFTVTVRESGDLTSKDGTSPAMSAFANGV